MTVGEMSSTTIEHCIKYTKPERQELNSVFHFHHLKVDYLNGEKWSNAKLNFLKLKEILMEWQIGIYQGGVGTRYSGVITINHVSCHVLEMIRLKKIAKPVLKC